MPNFRSDNRRDYKYLKPKTSQKFKKPFINLTRNDRWDEDNETKKWMKVSCKTTTPNCMPELLRELDEIILTYGNKKIRFQAINPIFSDDRLDFYLEVSRNDSRILYKNYNSIKRYDIKCMTFNDLYMPHVFPQDWINLIMQALDKRFTKIEATGETEVDLSSFSKDTLLKQQGLILKMSNQHVMKHVLNMFKDTNLKIITRLNISNNEISNVFQLELFFEHCTVSCVDISNNRINRLSDLKFMSKNAVTELNVLNNDFSRKLNVKQLQDEVRKYFPKLKILNGKTLPPSVIIAGESTSIKKCLPESLFSDKTMDVYTAFVSKYCQAFDNTTRDALCDFYSSESVMSVDCYSNEMPHCYRSINSNIFMMKNSHDSRSDNFKKGKAAILGTFVSFPRTKHIEETLNIDVAFRTTTDLMFTLTGTFIELPEKSSKSYKPRQFSRMFIINNGVILQDHLSLMPTDSSLYQHFKDAIEKVKEENEFPEKYKNELKNISSDAIEIVRQFKIFTGMTVKACLEFLSNVSNLSEATEKFTLMKEQGGIPHEAYEYK